VDEQSGTPPFVWLRLKKRELASSELMEKGKEKNNTTYKRKNTGLISYKKRVRKQITMK